jgi:hypothetical protein
MAKRGARKVRKADFIEAMECLPVTKIPERPEWTYELLCKRPHNSSSVAQPVMWRSAKQAAKFAPLEYFNAT